MIPTKINDIEILNEQERDELREDLKNQDLEFIKEGDSIHVLIASLDPVKDILVIDENEAQNRYMQYCDSKKNECGDFFISVILYHESIKILNNELGYSFNEDKRIFLRG